MKWHFFSKMKCLNVLPITQSSWPNILYCFVQEYGHVFSAGHFWEIQLRKISLTSTTKHHLEFAKTALFASYVICTSRWFLILASTCLNWGKFSGNTPFSIYLYVNIQSYFFLDFQMHEIIALSMLWESVFSERASGSFSSIILILWADQVNYM